MPLSEEEILRVYQHLNRVFKEDLHISRPLVQMLRNQDGMKAASEQAFLTAGHMLASHQPSSALGFLEVCRQAGHPPEDEVNSLMVIAELTGEVSETAQGRLFPLIEELSDSEGLAFLQQGRLQAFDAGNNVLTQNEVSDSFYLILDGSIHIHMQTGEQHITLTKLAAGNFFGEFASIYHLPRSATATAITDALLLELSANDIQKLIETSPFAGEYLVNIVKRRMIHSMSRSHPALARIAPIDRDWLAEKAIIIEFAKNLNLAKNPIPVGYYAIVFIGRLIAQDASVTLDVHAMFGGEGQAFTPLTVVERSFVYCIPEEVFTSFRNAYAEFNDWVVAWLIDEEE